MLQLAARLPHARCHVWAAAPRGPLPSSRAGAWHTRVSRVQRQYVVRMTCTLTWLTSRRHGDRLEVAHIKVSRSLESGRQPCTLCPITEQAASVHCVLAVVAPTLQAAEQQQPVRPTASNLVQPYSTRSAVSGGCRGRACLACARATAPPRAYELHRAMGRAPQSACTRTNPHQAAVWLLGTACATGSFWVQDVGMH